MNPWQWLVALVYLGQVAGMIALARLKYPGRSGRTMLIVENPDKPLTVEEAQAAIGDRGVVIPALKL